MGLLFRASAAIGLVGLAWTAAPAAAREHLVPDTARQGPLDEYDSNVRIVLKEAFAPGVELRAIVQPAFDPEYAVGLRRVGTRYEIFSLVPARRVWDYSLIGLMKGGQVRVLGSNGGNVMARQIAQLKKGLPKRPADLPVSRCTVEVDSAMAASLAGAWRSMLEGVRPFEGLGPGFGLDGIAYRFAMESGGRSLAGQAWTGEPETQTRTGKLSAVADAMRAYCRSRDPAEARRILALAGELGSD